MASKFQKFSWGSMPPDPLAHAMVRIRTLTQQARQCICPLSKLETPFINRYCV